MALQKKLGDDRIYGVGLYGRDPTNPAHAKRADDTIADLVSPYRPKRPSRADLKAAAEAIPARYAAYRKLAKKRPAPYAVLHQGSPGGGGESLAVKNELALSVGHDKPPKGIFNPIKQDGPIVSKYSQQDRLPWAYLEVSGMAPGTGKDKRKWIQAQPLNGGSLALIMDPSIVEFAEGVTFKSIPFGAVKFRANKRMKGHPMPPVLSMPRVSPPPSKKWPSSETITILKEDAKNRNLQGGLRWFFDPKTKTGEWLKTGEFEKRVLSTFGGRYFMIEIDPGEYAVVEWPAKNFTISSDFTTVRYSGSISFSDTNEFRLVRVFDASDIYPLAELWFAHLLLERLPEHATKVLVRSTDQRTRVPVVAWGKYKSILEEPINDGNDWGTVERLVKIGRCANRPQAELGARKAQASGAEYQHGVLVRRSGPRKTIGTTVVPITKTEANAIRLRVGPPILSTTFKTLRFASSKGKPYLVGPDGLDSALMLRDLRDYIADTLLPRGRNAALSRVVKKINVAIWTEE